MPKYLSGRSKKTPPSQIKGDRYRFLSVEDAEPNLGDPAIGGAVPPFGPQYQNISVLGYPGERYWIPIGGGLVPGSISIFDESTIVGGLNSTTQLNFVGLAVTAIGNGGVNPGIAVTIRIFSPGNNQELLFNSSDEFGTSPKLTFNSSNGLLTAGDQIIVGAGGTVITATSGGLIGIGTPNPTQELDVNGDVRIRGTIYDYTNQPGLPTQVIIKNSLGGLFWANQDILRAGAGGTYRNVQFHNSAGLVDGAETFVYDEINSRVGIGSTLPQKTLDVIGSSRFTGQTEINLLNVTGVTTTTTLAVAGTSTTRNLIVTGVTTLGFLTGTSAYYTGIVTAVKFVGNLNADQVYVTGISTFNGNVILGDVNTDTVTFNSRINSSVLPLINGTLNLGAALFEWDNVYANIFVGNLDGNAGTSTKLATARNISITGDLAWNVNFDGDGNVTSTGTLANTGVSANTYGSATTVPVFAVDSKGRITSVTNTGINFSNATVAQSDKIKSITTSTNASFFPTFVDSNNSVDAYEALYTDVGIYYNPSTDLLTLTNLTVDSNTSLKDLSISGKITSSVLPSPNATLNLGAAIFKWDSVYANTFVGNLNGKLVNARNIAITGDLAWNVNFDGSGNVTSTGTLANSGVTANTYGSSTIVPVFAVDAKGRITSVTNTQIDFDNATVSQSNNIKTIATTTNNSFFPTFVDSNNTVASYEALYTDAGISYNPSTDLLSLGNLIVTGISTFNGNLTLGDATSDTVTFNSRINSSVLPLINSTSNVDVDGKDLGGTSNRWRTVYANDFNGRFIGNADTASKLETARSISITGDLGWTVNFDGSGPVTGAGTLASTGVSADTYGNTEGTSYGRFTVDAKGRITSASNVGVNFTAATVANSDKIKTISSATNDSFYPTFVDSNNTVASYEALYTDAGISYNPSTDLLSLGNLTITGKITPSLGNTDLNGIIWPLDPGGGGGDKAFIRYYVESEENTRLHIGIQNDANDDIYLEAKTLYATGNFLPATNGTLNLGAADSKWGNIYATNFVGAITGNADTASKLETARSISITGDLGWSVTFDGSGPVTGAGTLATVNSNIGTWGNTEGTSYGRFTVDAKGRITSASNVGVNFTAATVANSDKIKTVATEINDSFYPTFVDSNNSSAGYESLYTDAGISYNPYADLLTLINLNITGNVTLGNANTDTVTFNSKINSSVLPTGNGAVNLGAADSKWGNIYATNFVGAITGNADTATKLQTARSISITGDLGWSVTFDGSGPVTGAGTLANSGVSANTYGSATTVPVFAVDSKGRITSASNVAVGGFDGSGSASQANTIKTVATSIDASFRPTFVDSHNTTAAYESLYTDSGISYNPYTDLLNLLNLTVTNRITGSITGDAVTLGGLALNTDGRADNANQVVRTDDNGYIQAGWINSTSGDLGVEYRLDRVYTSNDQYIRYLSLVNFKNQMGLSAKNNYSRRVDFTSDLNYSVGSMGHSGYGANETFHGGSGFFDIWNGTNFPGTYSHIHGINMLHYTVNSLGSTGGNAYGWQLATQYNDDAGPYFRRCNGTSFSGWRKIWHDTNDGSGSGLDADLLDGYNTAVSNTGSTIPVRDGSGGITNTYYSSAYVDANSGLTRSSYPYAFGFQEGGAWTNPYPDLVLQYHTGVTLAGNPTYEGIRFKNDYNDDTVRFQINGVSSYTYKYTWMKTNTTGFYSDTNSWHIYPNDVSSYGGTELRGSKNGWRGIHFYDGGNTPHVMFDGSANGGFYYETGGRWSLYYNYSNTSWGVNTSTTSSSYAIYTSGNIYATGTITAGSDGRKKKEVETISNALDKVSQLRGVTYKRTDYKDDDTNYNKTEMGVIAQEVEPIVPEVVTYAEDVDEYAVSYGNFAGLFIEAIKEQNAIINTLKAEIEQLKSKLGE